MSNISDFVTINNLTLPICGSGASLSAPANRSEGASDTYILVINGYMTTIVCVFGCFANFFAARIIRQVQRLQQAFKIFLTVLAVVDNSLLLCGLFYFSIDTVLRSWSIDCWWNVYTSTYLNVVSVFTMMWTAWMVVVVAASRHSAVTKPLMIKQSIFVLHPHLVWIGVLTSCLPVSAIVHFERRIRQCWNTITNQTLAEAVLTRLVTDDDTGRYYYFFNKVIFQATVHGIPFFLLCYYGIRMVYYLRKGKKEHDEICRRTSVAEKRSAQSEKQITIMVLVVIVKFLVTHILPIALNVIDWVHWNEISPSGYDYIVPISNFLVMINSCTNCFVYVSYAHWRTEINSLRLRASALVNGPGKPISALATAANRAFFATTVLGQPTQDTTKTILTKSYHQTMNDKRILHDSWSKAYADQGSGLGLKLIVACLPTTTSRGRGGSFATLLNASHENHRMSTVNTIMADNGLVPPKETDPFLIQNCGAVVDDSTLCENEAVRAEGQRICTFFDKLLALESLQSDGTASVKETHQHTELDEDKNLAQMTNIICEMTATHRLHGVTLTNHLWREFKMAVFEHVLGIEPDQIQRELENRSRNDVVVWNRFLSFLFSVVKLSNVPHDMPKREPSTRIKIVSHSSLSSHSTHVVTSGQCQTALATPDDLITSV